MKKTKLEKGITLIALIITIIILLILAVVTIGSIQDSEIIDYAQKAGSEYSNAQEEEMIQLGFREYQLAKYANNLKELTVEGASTSVSENGWLVKFDKSGNEYKLNFNGTLGTIEPEEPITNQYEGVKEWDLAYVCINGAWENTPLEQGDTIPEDATIVAKFYKTGEMITPTFPDGSLPEGEEYHMVVEGTGDIPKMLEGESGFAWQHDQWIEGENVQYNLYVTELTICTGITSIGEGAFYQGLSLKKVTIPSSVTIIEEDAFMCCWNLTGIILPNSITRIEDGAFHQCGLINVTIPHKVSFIGWGAFGECYNLQIVKILATSCEIEKITNNTNAFESLAEGATIYVLNNDVAQKLEGTYDDTTTVKVVPVDEINGI